MSIAPATEVDLLALGSLPPLPTAFLEGRDRDLLGRLRFLSPGELPDGPPPGVERSAVAEALAGANDSYAHPRASELAEKLADPATRVVIAGQQPGIGGGPLYTLSKAMAVVRYVEELERRGEVAVPLFWVATEDHDFAEVSRVAVPVRKGLERWDLGEDPAPLTPVGMRTLGAGIDDLLDAWRDSQPAEPYRRWIDDMASWYRPEARFGEAFSRLMVGMMGERCPLLIDAMLPAVKRAQSPHLLRLVERRAELDAELAVADEAIEARGYALQVRPAPGLSPLFLQRGGERRRIEWKGDDRFTLRGRDDFEADVEELLETARDNPAVLSPGVLARPALQDAVFGSFLQVLGPGEISYFPQTVPVFDLLGVEATWIAARPQMLVLPARQAGHLLESGVDPEDLVAGRLDVDAVIASRAGDDLVEPVAETIDSELRSLRAPLVELEPGLESALEKTRGQIRRALEALSGRTAAASARRHEVERNRLEALVDTVRPDGTPQERIVTSAHYVGRHDAFVERSMEQLGLDPRRLHFIDPDAG